MEIAHLYNDKKEEWFSKYMKNKGHQEKRITPLLQRHLPLSNIAGYNLAQSSAFGMFRSVSTQSKADSKLRKRGRNS